MTNFWSSNIQNFPLRVRRRSLFNAYPKFLNALDIDIIIIYSSSINVDLIINFATAVTVPCFIQCWSCSPRVGADFVLENFVGRLISRTDHSSWHEYEFLLEAHQARNSSRLKARLGFCGKLQIINIFACNVFAEKPVMIILSISFIKINEEVHSWLDQSHPF